MAGDPVGGDCSLQEVPLDDGRSPRCPGGPLGLVLLAFPSPLCFSTPKALLSLLFVVKIVKWLVFSLAAVSLFGFSIVVFCVRFGSMVRLLRVECGIWVMGGEMLMERKITEEETIQMIVIVTTTSSLQTHPHDEWEGSLNETK